jgi:hypothetical protein
LCAIVYSSLYQAAVALAPLAVLLLAVVLIHEIILCCANLEHFLLARLLEMPTNEQLI